MRRRRREGRESRERKEERGERGREASIRKFEARCVRKSKKQGYIEYKVSVTLQTRSQDTFEVSNYITLIGMLARCYTVTPWTLRCFFSFFVVERKESRYCHMHSV